jgi:hypothetical protein
MLAHRCVLLHQVAFSRRLQLFFRDFSRRSLSPVFEYYNMRRPSAALHFSSTTSSPTIVTAAIEEEKLLPMHRSVG